MSNHEPSCTRRSVLKGLAAGTAACVIGDLAGGLPSQAAQLEHGKLPRTTPEAAGIAPSGVQGFVDAVNEKVGGLHSFILLRHGQVAAEGWWAPYAPSYPHMLYSLSKSFTSTAVGLAIEQGVVKLDTPVIHYFPDDLPASVSENLRSVQVRHLLSMSVGHDKDSTGPVTNSPDGNWVKTFLSLPVEHEPGTHFVYNSGATYMLSAIVQKQTGMKVVDYLRPRLFGPLGIEGETWDTCPRGINTGGWGLNVKTEDIARFGQLYLQKGRWDGKQLLPEHWVSEASTKHISNGTDPNSDWAQGYCYQFWRCRHNAFRGDGAFGQYCVVMPEQDAVLAITSGLGDMQAVLNAAWDHLLPAMSGSAVDSRGGGGGLKRRLESLSVPAPTGQAASETGKRVSGKTYRFPANTEHLVAATPVFHAHGCTVALKSDHGEHELRCGADQWMKGTALFTAGAPLNPPKNAPVGARGAWLDGNTYAMKICFYETPYVQTLTWKFNGDEVTLDSKMNVGFGKTDRPPLTGHADA